MIDIANEELIPVRDVPDRLPPGPKGKRLHVSAVYRWIKRGLRGIHLDAVRLGGTTYTSVEPLQRFAEQQSGPDGRESATPAATTGTRRRQIERAAREVEGILGPIPAGRISSCQPQPPEQGQQVGRWRGDAQGRR